MIKTKTIEKYILPVKIAYCGGRITGTENLFTERFTQITVEEISAAIFAPGAFIVFDFGRELCGGVRILTKKVENSEDITKVRLRFGESLSECFSEPGERHSTNHHSPRDLEYLIPSMSDITVGGTGFRFVRLDFIGDCNVGIAGVYAAFRHADISPAGSFECDDPLINRIYETARETVFLNMQNGVLWDGIKRDRLVWAGDLNPEINAALYAFGDIEHISNSLNFSKNCTPLPGWINGIPAYSMWWIINLYDYYMYSGDRKYLCENIEYATGVLRQINECLNLDGTIDFCRAAEAGMAMFLDWPTYGTECVSAGVISLLKIALRRASYLFKQTNMPDMLCGTIAAKLKTEKIPENCPKQIHAMRIWSGEECADAAIAKLIKGGAAGVSAFMSEYILDAVYAANKPETALAIMKEYFGGMLLRGATTFWEDFDIEWLKGSGRIDELPLKGQKDLHGDFGSFCYQGFRKSLCHGWAAGPVPLLVKRVLGLTINEPGCKSVSVTPILSGLKYANGVFPTPLGTISIKHEQTSKGIHTEIKAPEGVTVRR